MTGSLKEEGVQNVVAEPSSADVGPKPTPSGQKLTDPPSVDNRITDLGADSSGWQPIETAPKDEVIVVLGGVGDHYDPMYAVAEWGNTFGLGRPADQEREGWMIWYAHGYRFADWATHWKALAPLPDVGGDGVPVHSPSSPEQRSDPLLSSPVGELKENNTLVHPGGTEQPLDQTSPCPDWFTAPATGLEAAIAEFKAALPGWWFSVCECQVSCDASCAPTGESEDIERIAQAGDPFDHGFHADLLQPSTMAEALRDVMRQAQSAIGASDHD